VYLFTFVLPLVIAFWVPKYQSWCYIIGLISLTIFFQIEICQMKQSGIKNYLMDFWNIIDSTQFIVFGYLTFDVLVLQNSEDQRSVFIKILYFIALL
jgi:hypothetical protein